MKRSHTLRGLRNVTCTFTGQQALDLVGVSYFEWRRHFHVMLSKPRKCLRTIANCESVIPSVMSSPACTVRFLFVPLQIPVACKSCPCGYVFISRKLLNAKLNERSSPAIAGIAWGQPNLTKVIYLLFCLHHFVWPYVNRSKAYSGLFFMGDSEWT